MKKFKLGDRLVDPLASTIEIPDEGSTRVEPRSMQVLLRLVAQGGDLTPREALFEDVWEGRAVSDDVLTGSISILRKALGDSARSPRYIQTVSGEGYRIVAPILEIAEPQSESGSSQSRWFAAGVICLLALVLLSFALLSNAPSRTVPPSEPQTPSAEVVRIAVLPFENLSDLRPLDHLAAGITDGVITELARRGELRVLSRTSILRFAGTDLPLPQIAETLEADLVIEGAVLPIGDDLRVSAQLIDSTTDTHLWADEFLRSTSDVHGLIFDLSATIGTRVADATAPEPLPTPSLEDPRAHEAFWHARYLLDRPTPQALDRAQELLDETVELAPDFARAYLELARLAYYRLELGNDADAALAALKTAARRAIELEPRLPGGATYLAIHALVANRDFESAERLLESALRSSPSDAQAQAWLANLYLITGRLDDAAHALRQTDVIDPDPGTYAGRSFLLYLAGHKATAIERIERLLDEPEVHPATHLVASRIFAAEGDEPRALEQLKISYPLFGIPGEPPWDEGLESVQRWRIAAWETRRQAGETVSLASLATLYASVGERDRALALLREADEQKELLALFSDLWPELRSP